MKLGLLVAVFVSLILPESASAQGSGVFGRVTDSTGGDFTGVKVTISGPALRRPLNTQTAAGGIFQFANLPDGTYQLVFDSLHQLVDSFQKASCLSFSKLVKRDVIVRSGFITRIDASLPIGEQEFTVVAGADNDLVQVTTSLAAAAPLTVDLAR